MTDAVRMADRFATSGWKAKTKEGRKYASLNERTWRRVIVQERVEALRKTYYLLSPECVAAYEMNMCC